MDELTIEDYESKKKELAAMAVALKAKGMEIVDEKGKPLYRSKIFWANVIALGVTAAGALGYNLSAEETAALVGAFIPMLNIVMRYWNKDISGVVN